MNDVDRTDPALLTISELARFVGVTVRAVRHYHALGLLPEPERDASGYRRYDAQAVVDLIHIKVLADAGVPLARVGELLDADAADFAEAIEDIDRHLDEEIERLRHHRKRIAELAAGESMALPSEGVALLDRLREIGVSERGVAFERDGWILVAAHEPDDVVAWINHKAAAFEDEAFCVLYRRFDEAFDWDPDDPRLDDLADTMAAFVRRLQDEDPAALADKDDFDDSLVEVIESQVLTASPAWRRLTTLVAERGWSGWASIEPTEDTSPPAVR
jgi:DNA-binding transcriptional MerR regulator